MLNRSLFLFLFMALTAVAADNASIEIREPGTLKAVRNAAKTTNKFIPHVSANDLWKSSLIIRSDASYPVSIFLDLYDENGNPAFVHFTTPDGLEHVGAAITVTLHGFALTALEFDRIEGGYNSFQVHAYSGDSHRFYSMETIYNRYENGLKVASVGVPTLQHSPSFLMNMDERFDPYSGYQRFRGLALTNATRNNCNCDVFLYDEGVNGENVDGYIDAVSLSLNGYGKWVGLIIDLFPNIDDLMPNGLGYILVQCDRDVTGLGLAFEVDSPVAGSVPIDPLE